MHAEQPCICMQSSQGAAHACQPVCCASMQRGMEGSGCMAVHNFIRESKISDREFDLCDQDENYVPLHAQSSNANATDERDSAVMNQFRDWVADGLWSLK